MKRHVFRLPRARAASPYPRLARENEQLCIVMFLAILLFRIFCYIIVRLKKQRILLLRKRMTKMVHKR